jgi:hypothetical protein
VFPYEPIASKENTASAFGLEITGVKPKKTVTINDSPMVYTNFIFSSNYILFLFSLAVERMIYAVQIQILPNFLVKHISSFFVINNSIF